MSYICLILRSNQELQTINDTNYSAASLLSSSSFTVSEFEQIRLPPGDGIGYLLFFCLVCDVLWCSPCVLQVNVVYRRKKGWNAGTLFPENGILEFYTIINI